MNLISSSKITTKLATLTSPPQLKSLHFFRMLYIQKPTIEKEAKRHIMIDDAHNLLYN